MKNILLVSLLLSSVSAFAAEHTVKMLNMGKDGTMVFEPGLLTIEVGDTVNFVATDMAHNSASVLTPAGVSPWFGKMSKDISVTFDTEGVYIYECTPHKMMAMVGVIQVGGSPVDEATLNFAQRYKKNFVMNQSRLDQYLGQL